MAKRLRNTGNLATGAALPQSGQRYGMPVPGPLDGSQRVAEALAAERKLRQF